jgi:tetratricopeptide (TPR) repeat protein
LKEDAKWAYILLCESSVYRCPVPEDFWLSHLEDWDRDEEEQRAALDILRDRYLVEELIGNNSQHLLRQHNLVRSVALERLKFIDNTENVLDEKKFKILEELNSCFTNFDLKEIEPKQLSSATPRGSYREIVNWLNLYQPGVNSSKIERVRGYLEAFRHFCDLADWENANRIISLQVNTSTSQKLLEQLGTWGYYGEQISLCEKLLGRLNQTADFRLRSCLGNAAYIHGNYDLAIQYFQQSLQVANQSDARNEMAAALNSLGTVYNVLGNYGQAIEYYQQALSITREIGNRLEEGYTLGNLGLAYNFLGNYEQAVAYCQQALTISREIGDRHSEENMLGNLGIAYASLANYSQAVEYHQYQLTIAREIGDRRGEAIALSRLGSCLINLHQYSDSLSYLETALQTFNEIGDRANQASSLKALAELYQGLGQLDTALQCAEQALNIATELGIPLVQEIQNLEALIREA